MNEKLIGPGSDISPLDEVGGAVVVEHGEGGVDGDDLVRAVALDQVDLKNGLGFAHGFFSGVAAFLGIVALTPMLEGLGPKILGGEIPVDVNSVGIGAGGTGLEKRVGVGDGGDRHNAVFEGIRFGGVDVVEVFNDVETKFYGGDFIAVNSAKDQGAILGADIFLGSVNFPNQGMPADRFADGEPVVFAALAVSPVIFFKMLLDGLAVFLKGGIERGRLGFCSCGGWHGMGACQKQSQCRCVFQYFHLVSAPLV